MPEPELRQRVEGLQKVEGFLKQQVSELEEDRQQLYDLLRDDKKAMHELKIKLRSVELSEDNYKRKYDQMSDTETRLMEEKEGLEGRVRELEVELSILAKKTGTDKNTETTLYESEEEKKLKEDLEKSELENDKLNEYVEEFKKKNKTQMESKSFDTSEEFPYKNETKELLAKIEDLNKKFESEKVEQKLKLSIAENEIGKLKAEIIVLENNEKSLKDKIDPLELDKLQMSVKVSKLEKQLKDMRITKFQEPVPLTITETVETKKPARDKDKDKRKLLDNLASIMATMDDPNYNEKKKEVVTSVQKDSEEVSRLQMEIEQLKKSFAQQLQERDDEHEEVMSKLRRDVAENEIGRERELDERVEGLEDRLRRKAGQVKSVQTDGSDKATASIKVQSEESLFAVRALKKAETQTSDIESPEIQTSNASVQTEDVEIRGVVYIRSRSTQTVPEEDDIGRRFFKSQFIQTEDQEEKLTRNRGVQVDFEDEGRVKVDLKGLGTQTSLDDDDGGSGAREVGRLQRSLLNAENEVKSQEEEIEALRRDLNDKDRRLKTINKDLVRQTTVVDELSSDKKSANEKYIFLLEACKLENSNLEGELEIIKETLERKKKEDGEMEREKEMRLAETFQRLKVTKKDLQKSENNLVSEQEEKTAIVKNQTAEIEILKKEVMERDEEVKCLWADLNKIQTNYTNYIDASEKDCLQLEERIRELEGEVGVGRAEVDRLGEELRRNSERLRKTDDEWNKMLDKQKSSSMELSALKRVASKKEEEVRILITDLNGLQAKYANLVEEHENCGKNDSDLRKGFEECKVDLRQAMERNMEQSRQLETKENKLNFLHTTNKELEEKNQLNDVDIDELKNKLQKIELQNEFLNSSNEQRMRVVASTIMREKNEKLSGESLSSVQISFLKKTIKSKDEEIKLLTDDLNNIHKRYLDLLQKHPKDGEPSNKEERDKVVARLRKELERKDEENVALLTSQDALDDKYQKLFGDKEKETKDFMREKSSLINELRQKSKSLEEKSKQLELLSQQLEDLQNENETLAKTSSDLKVKVIQVGNALKTSSFQNKELLTQCKNNQRSISEVYEREKELTQEKKNSDLDAASLKHKLENALKGLKDMSESQTMLKDQLAKTQVELEKRQDAQARVDQSAKNLQDKDKQLQSLREQMKGLRRQTEEFQEEKKDHKKSEHIFQLLRKEYDGLTSHSKKQSVKLKELQANEKLLTQQLKEKESDLKGMNVELERCSELSRRLNILNASR